MRLKNYLVLVSCGLLVAGFATGTGQQEERKLEAEGVAAEEQVAAEAAVSAEDGGPGFTGEGWETNTNPITYGSPDATKGGSLTLSWSEYPETLRTEGARSNTSQIGSIGGMVYEALLGFDMQDMKFSPSLATHWKRNADDSVYHFRLDPNAEWSDGEPVTAADVIATLGLLQDEGIGAPFTNELYSKFTVEKISDYIIKVTNSDPNWRDFLYIGAGTTIFPAKYLSKIDGETYLEKYNDQMMPGTGPYIMNMDKTVPGELFVLKRRPDYWAADYDVTEGLHNFDEIRYLVVRDETLEKEKFKKGELDMYVVGRAQWWVQEFDLENPEPDFAALRRGLVQKRKIFSFDPKGVSGLAFNIRKPPFDDIRMRKALAMLWNRDQLIETLFFNEYTKLNSQYPGSVYMSPDRTIVPYDPAQAAKLLDEMGWTGRNAEGYRTDGDGNVLNITLPIHQAYERIFTPMQEDLKEAGIKLDLEITDWNTMWQMVMERRFSLVFMSWTGLSIPNPESSLHSNLAEPDNTNNIWGFKNERVDILLEQYNEEKDPRKRVEIIQEIDAIVTDAVLYAYGWVAPFTNRVLYWHKFGMPEWYYSFSGDFSGITAMWWYDPDRAAVLERAGEDESITLEYGPQEIDYWGVQER
jgi:microcin C transport system substrate-binding protein